MNETTQPVCASGSCAACMMPFTKDPGVRENSAYCSYCFNNGKLNCEGMNLSDFQAMCYQSMKKSGMHTILAKIYTWMIRFAPYWRNKK